LGQEMQTSISQHWRGFAPSWSEKRRGASANWFVLDTQNITDIGGD